MRKSAILIYIHRIRIISNKLTSVENFHESNWEAGARSDARDDLDRGGPLGPGDHVCRLGHPPPPISALPRPTATTDGTTAPGTMDSIENVKAL